MTPDGSRPLKVEAQRVFSSDRRRTIRLTGDMEQILEFENRFVGGGRVMSSGRRIDPVFLRRNFDWTCWEFSLPGPGRTHRFLLEVESVLGTILTFRCYLDQLHIYEDRDQGRDVVVGSLGALSDHPIAAQPPGFRVDLLPLAVEEDRDDGAVAG